MRAFYVAHTATEYVVEAVRQEQLDAWRQSPHCIPRLAHRLISIETLLQKAQELQPTSLLVH